MPQVTVPYHRYKNSLSSLQLYCIYFGEGLCRNFAIHAKSPFLIFKKLKYVYIKSITVIAHPCIPCYLCMFWLHTVTAGKGSLGQYPFSTLIFVGYVYR